MRLSIKKDIYNKFKYRIRASYKLYRVLTLL